MICAYAEQRWPALLTAVRSVAEQSLPAEEIIVVIDSNPRLLALARRELGRSVLVEANRRAAGLSGARNTGLELASGDIVAFLDDDASAPRDWLAALTAPYVDGQVIGTGGVVEPRWPPGARTAWLPPEFLWTVGCSYVGLPTEVAPVRNPIGANMSFRRQAMGEVGGFREGVGRLEATPLGCEETEMAVRIGSAFPRARILHVPAARVQHAIDPDRVRWRYFVRRCWAEGISKAIVTAHVGSGAGLASERSYVRRTLPRGILGGLRDAVRGEPAGMARAGAIVTGLTVSAAGFAAGRLRSARGRPLEALALGLEAPRMGRP